MGGMGLVSPSGLIMGEVWPMISVTMTVGKAGFCRTGCKARLVAWAISSARRGCCKRKE